MKMKSIQSRPKQSKIRRGKEKKRRRKARGEEDATGGVASHMRQAVGSGTVRATNDSLQVYGFRSGLSYFPSFVVSRFCRLSFTDALARIIRSGSLLQKPVLTIRRIQMSHEQIVSCLACSGRKWDPSRRKRLSS